MKIINLKRLLLSSFLLLVSTQTRAGTFFVSNTNDSGAGSLRQAVADANAAGSDDQVVFDQNLFGIPQVITLTSGELVISNNGALVINGPVARLLTISGNQQSRVLHITGGTVVLTDLTISNGRSTLAGGIHADGSTSSVNLTLERVVVSSNSAVGANGVGSGASGESVGVGGIYVNGNVTLNHSRIINNTAQGGLGVDGSGPFPATPGGSGGSAHTGGIYVNGTLIMNNSVVRLNRAIGGNAGRGGDSIGTGTSGGAGGHAGSATAGGINIQPSSTATITNSTVSENTAFGGIAGRGGNSQGSGMGTQFGGKGGDGGGGYGAGVYVNHLASLNVSNSLFANNVAQSSGGGNGGTITPTGNPGVGGAGVNSEGGAIWNAGTLVVRNSTLNGNSVKGGSQGLGFVNTCGQSRGGGLYTSLNSSLINVTVTQNQAIPEFVICSISGLGGGVFGAGGTTEFGNTIIADNTGSAGLPSAPDLSGTFTSLGNNLVENTTGGTITGNTSGNITGQDPQLGTLQYHGGVASARAPNVGSPVINAGNSTLATNSNLNTDQRATCFRRIVGSAVDIGAFEVQVTASLVCNNFDYDGDGLTDISVFRPADGYWYLRRSSSGATDSIPFGQQGDVLAPADFDGDGKTDVTVFRDGYWYRLNSSSNLFVATKWGVTLDYPVPGDYDGDGLADLAVFRQGTWHILQSRDGYLAVQFGISIDRPVPGDYDRDGKNDLAVYRNGDWYIQQSRDGFRSAQFGISTDRPLAADFDGDGKADLTVFRDGSWYLLQSQSGLAGVQFGLVGDVPVAGDYDGDGKADIAVFRDGSWYVLQSGSGFTGLLYGLPGDLPTPAAFVP